MIECKFNGCSLPVICKGLCGKHSTALYRGQILEDGTPLPHYKPRTITKRCTFKGCTRPHHGAGFCNLHRKWLYKGYIDKDHNILNPEKTKERPKKCKVCKSPKLKGLGFCYSHYCSYKRGVLDLSGERLKPMVRYSKDFICIVPGCHTNGKMARGMCKRHYNMARLGRIDWQGVEVREPKRVSSYRGRRCRICINKARSKGFCHKHYSSYKKGMIDLTGKWLVPQPTRNKGFKCKDPECDREARCKGYCAKHYAREKTGFVGWKNKGYTCSEEGCPKPAIARTLCHNHYRLLRFEEKAQEMLKNSSINFQFPEDFNCLE